MAKVTMPRVTIVPGVENSTINVQLTKATQINAGNPSAFPLAKDNFKGLNYQSASKSELKTQLAEYYAIMNRIMAGTKTDADLANLTTLTTQIREFVLTDDDYNLVVGALQNMQTYILNFMYTDINNKAKAMDAQLNAVIGDINRFMSDLETVYSKSPSQYPIPDNSVLTAKLEQPVQDTLTYTNSTRGVIISNTKPANPVSKEIIWFNTGTPVR
ncbi:MAG: hypothetical protein J6A25_04870 [Lachnospiraceae bacterium]|nr:hypothetical protein [Lachnospiraceae bacterium]MBP3905945.1 hypothetical protein [Peptostreptococcaceae bacterium]